jgi:quinol monooxygenase YgiN
MCVISYRWFIVAASPVRFVASRFYLPCEAAMLLIVGTLRLPAAALVAARPAMRAMVESSRAEAGCLDYSYAEDLFDAGLIHVTELWTDQNALDRHFASAHIAAWRANWPALGIGERRLVVHEVGEGRAV